MLALSSLNSQPVPGWAIKSNINNSNSQSKDIDLGLNTSEDKSNQNNSFNNAVDNSSSSAEGQNKNYENKNETQTENEFSKAEQREIEKLKRRDREVRAHEMAHQSAGGQYAGSASYSYTTGPDNRRYAVGGSVDIETSPAKTPEETVKKADQIKRAATAPAQPSGADLQIAAKATRMKMEAQSELNQNEISGENEETESSQEINKNEDSIFENKYLINKRESSYQNSSREISSNQGFAA
ncbi:SprA family protein [Halanaerobium saccharolyticum]|uniref:SprA family protein n=1 Tax=Halanaerobium saccharolyticum TaxID=43595 RepID=A0A4R7Z2U5_9FIRM|nr:putative metalloprotease CJM1_0395 family protein [Halanaerobium saccharolyticum]RAK07848.1 SprA family protein [Halanaerobium saccharolyticum]TDW04462.1 SprA family protein [Halanaerobium saccharolyticum]TDX59798.1 SprA family protein [Halanaerobium saccharolyticum]